MSSHLIEFTERKVALAVALNNGSQGGTYGDSILVLSSLISALAALTWPGKFIDKVRFVEAWQRYCDSDLKPIQIAIPLLANERRDAGDDVTVRALEATNSNAFCGYPEYDTLVITGPEVDLSESQVQALCPGLTLRQIRNRSYPAVFYEEVRSPWVHEFSAGELSSGHAMSHDEAVVSYVNQTPKRMIYFGVPFVVAVARSIAGSIDRINAGKALSRPAIWWLQE